MVKRPVKDFWDASHHTNPDKTEAKAEEKPQTIRDQDNAAPEFKPNFASKPRDNQAPYGAKGIQTGLGKHTAEEQQPVSLVKDHPHPHLLTDGRFSDQPNISYVLKIENYRTHYGIEQGKITQLEMQDQGRIVAQFTGGQWTKIPDKEAHKELVQSLQDKFGDRPKEFQPIIKDIGDKGIDHER